MGGSRGSCWKPAEYGSQTDGVGVAEYGLFPAVTRINILLTRDVILYGTPNGDHKLQQS